MRDARGLTTAEARARLAATGPNSTPAPRPPSVMSRVLTAARDPMSVLLLGAAAVSGFGLRQAREAIGILAIVVLNIVIGLAQEGRAARALEALRALEAPLATVVRDGVVRTIAASAVVPGDLLVLTAGERIPADIRLIESFGIEADESLLTGESLPVAKRAGDDPEEGIVFAGTVLTRGAGRGICIRTGAATALGAIAQHLDERTTATPLQSELRALATRLGLIALAIATGVFVLTIARLGFSARSLQESFLGAVALAVAAIPEGVPTVVTVALALGVRRMASKKVIVRRLAAVETLGAATVILSDKTGTLTENRMHVEGLWLPDGRAAEGASRERIARAAVLCNDAEVAEPADPIEVALLRHIEGIASVRRLPRVDEIPFSSERMRMTTLHDDGARALLIVKGAPEVVAGLCERASTPHGDGPLAMRDVEASVSDLASTGARVLAFAERTLDRAPQDLAEAECGMTLLGYASFRDPIRPECARVVAEAADAGVRVVMVTGDHARTAMAIARDAGLAGPESRAITGDDLRAGGIPADPLAYSVYARVDPLQKLALVSALQDRGHVLAVTGDGINDAPALRRADIGVAVGRGSDVAREAADMVVTDGDLAAIVHAIKEGRGIYDNVRKVVDYLVAGNLSEIAVVVVSLFAFPALGVPFLPLQLLWVNLLTDGPAALALGVDRPDPSLMQSAPRAREKRMMTRAHITRLFVRASIIGAAPVTGGVVATYVWHSTWPETRTVIFTILVIAHLLYALVARAPDASRSRHIRPNATLIGAIALGIGLQLLVLVVHPLRSVLGMTALDARAWAIVVALGITPPVAIRFLERRFSGSQG